MFTVVVFTFFGIIKKAFIGYIMIIKKKKKINQALFVSCIRSAQVNPSFWSQFRLCLYYRRGLDEKT